MFEYDRLALDVAEQFTNKNFNVSSRNNQHCFESILKTPGNQSQDEISRRLSGGSCSTDVFDCGASSGYGSPGLIGTPLASPAPNVQCLATQLHKMLLDQGFSEDSTNGIAVPMSSSLNSSISGHSPRSYELLAFSNSMKDLKPNSLQMPSMFGLPIPNPIEFSSVEDKFEEEGKASSMPPLPPQTPVPTAKNGAKPSNHVAVEDGFSNDEIAQFAELLCSPKKAPPVRYQCHICGARGGDQSGHYISDCPMVCVTFICSL